MKSLIRKFIPKSVLRAHHRLMAKTADFWYGHPSGKMIVIGVTGTKGKSTTCFMLAKILEEAGFKVGMTSTAMFKIAEREWINPYKMTMLGRFKLQKMLKQMVDVGCQYAVVETSSEGIAQWRHAGIEYDAAVLTNLAPEHLETHGGFEKYKLAKSLLFAKLKNQKIGAALRGQTSAAGATRGLASSAAPKNKKIIIVNGDDEHAEYFLGFPADEKYVYGLTDRELGIMNQDIVKTIKAENIVLEPQGLQFIIHDSKFIIHLLGKFNVYNALAAVAVANSQGIGFDVCQKALEKIKVIPGRLEAIEEGQNFKVFVDYAHNPSSFEALYEAMSAVPHQRIIHVFGATGGGRDKSKRAEMGRIASQHANVIILTTDDPYEEEPAEISEQVRAGIMNYELRIKNGELFEIADRREAIKKAIEVAQEGDVVLITGKGCEQKMAIGGKMIPWDDREIARAALCGLLKK